VEKGRRSKGVAKGHGVKGSRSQGVKGSRGQGRRKQTEEAQEQTNKTQKLTIIEGKTNQENTG